LAFELNGSFVAGGLFGWFVTAAAVVADSGRVFRRFFVGGIAFWLYQLKIQRLMEPVKPIPVKASFSNCCEAST
jgi:hypothetical protein